jgi:hypothetical protein
MNKSFKPLMPQGALEMSPSSSTRPVSVTAARILMMIAPLKMLSLYIYYRSRNLERRSLRFIFGINVVSVHIMSRGQQCLGEHVFAIECEKAEVTLFSGKKDENSDRERDLLHAKSSLSSEALGMF